MTEHVLQKTAKYPGFNKVTPAADRSQPLFKLSRYLPRPELAPFIEHHWTLHWDLRGRLPYIAEVLPHSSVNMVFTVERGWIAGVATGMYTYEVSDAGTIFGTMVKPGGFHTFWNKDVSTISNQEIDAATVFPELDQDFRYSLFDQENDEAMVAKIEDALLSKRPRVDQNLSLITAIMEAVNTDDDLRTVEMVANRFSVSERTVQHIFKKYLGVGLKWVLMRHRLIKAVELAAQLDDLNWASVAAHLGYSHQPHFVSDFKKIVGKSPEQYAQYIRGSLGIDVINQYIWRCGVTWIANPAYL